MKNEKYYAAIQSDGPAFGIGKNVYDAWVDASYHTDTFADIKIQQITADSYQAILAGDPDAYEIIEN